VVRHDERPGCERHELPAEQIGKRVIRQHHEIHAGQEGGEEGKHAVRRRIVMAVAETVKTCRSSSEIDDDEEKRSEGIHAEMGAEPRQPDRQGHARGIRRVTDQPANGSDQCSQANRQRRAVDYGRGTLGAAQGYRENRDSKHCCDARHLPGNSRDDDLGNHVRILVPLDAASSRAALAEPGMTFNRTPRPCELLTAPSSIISIPAASKAAISLTSESTLPRTIVSLASMR
jgi:hypothetical protein